MPVEIKIIYKRISPKKLKTIELSGLGENTLVDYNNRKNPVALYQIIKGSDIKVSKVLKRLSEIISGK